MTSESSFPHAPPPPPPPPPRSRSLVRSRSDRVLGGVAGGIARTYNVDVALVRIGFVLAAVLGGVGVLLYAIAWLVVPEEETGDVVVRGIDHGGRDGSRAVPIILLVVGIVLAANRFDHRGPWVFEFFWPLALIAAGVVLLLARARRDDASDAGAPHTEQSPAPAADPVQAQPWVTVTEPEAGAPTASAWTQAAPWPVAPVRRPRPPRPKPFLGPLVVSLLLVFAGGTALLHSTDVVEVDPQAAFAIALVGVGAALVVSARYGRARGLVALGLALLLPLVTLTMVDVPFEGGAGEREYRPATLAEVDDEYRLVAGDLTLDLRAVDVSGVTEIESSVGFGELRVLVATGQPVDVRAEVGGGEIEVFGRSRNGFQVDFDRSSSIGTGDDVLRLDLRVGFGHIVVERVAPDGGTVQEDAS